MRTGAARGSVGNLHEAGFYADDSEFLALIVPFVVEGLAAGEPVVIGYDARKSDLLRAALAGPARVTFIVDQSLYASPARAIEAYRRQFERHVAAGAGQIRIAGDVPHEGNGGRFEGWDRYESAVNAVWQEYPVWSRCLYDATTVPDDVRDVVERTHRRLVTPDGRAAASPRYQDVGEFAPLPPAADPLEATAPAVRLVDASLKTTRHRVADAAHGRVGDAVLDELVFALSEAVVNAHVHGRPPTTVDAWTGEGRVLVRVHDAGPGPPDPLTGLVPAPGGCSGAGLGLWLTHQLDHVDVALLTDATGFTVRLRGGRPPAPAGTPVGTAILRAGTPHGFPPGPGTVHVVDGDGSSFCGLVGPEALVPLDGRSWSHVPLDQRCSSCRLLAPGDDDRAAS
jgi:anti-sigma regulatory factor (Ser/Thr protein kinase)